jgi:hypothetical protein
MKRKNNRSIARLLVLPFDLQGSNGPKSLGKKRTYMISQSTASKKNISISHICIRHGVVDRKVARLHGGAVLVEIERERGEVDEARRSFDFVSHPLSMLISITIEKTVVV